MYNSGCRFRDALRRDDAGGATAPRGSRGFVCVVTYVSARKHEDSHPTAAAAANQRITFETAY